MMMMMLDKKTKKKKTIGTLLHKKIKKIKKKNLHLSLVTVGYLRVFFLFIYFLL